MADLTETQQQTANKAEAQKQADSLDGASLPFTPQTITDARAEDQRSEQVLYGKGGAWDTNLVAKIIEQQQEEDKERQRRHEVLVALEMEAALREKKKKSDLESFWFEQLAVVIGVQAAKSVEDSIEKFCKQRGSGAEVSQANLLKLAHDLARALEASDVLDRLTARSTSDERINTFVANNSELLRQGNEAQILEALSAFFDEDHALKYNNSQNKSAGENGTTLIHGSSADKNTNIVEQRKEQEDSVFDARAFDIYRSPESLAPGGAGREAFTREIRRILERTGSNIDERTLESFISVVAAQHRELRRNLPEGFVETRAERAAYTSTVQDLLVNSGLAGALARQQGLSADQAATINSAITNLVTDVRDISVLNRRTPATPPSHPIPEVATLLREVQGHAYIYRPEAELLARHLMPVSQRFGMNLNRAELSDVLHAAAIQVEGGKPYDPSELRRMIAGMLSKGGERPVNEEFVDVIYDIAQRIHVTQSQVPIPDQAAEVGAGQPAGSGVAQGITSAANGTAAGNSTQPGSGNSAGAANSLDHREPSPVSNASSTVQPANGAGSNGTQQNLVGPPRLPSGLESPDAVQGVQTVNLSLPNLSALERRLTEIGREIAEARADFDTASLRRLQDPNLLNDLLNDNRSLLRNRAHVDELRALVQKADDETSSSIKAELDEAETSLFSELDERLKEYDIENALIRRDSFTDELDRYSDYIYDLASQPEFEHIFRRRPDLAERLSNHAAEYMEREVASIRRRDEDLITELRANTRAAATADTIDHLREGGDSAALERRVLAYRTRLSSSTSSSNNDGFRQRNPDFETTLLSEYRSALEEGARQSRTLARELFAGLNNAAPGARAEFLETFRNSHGAANWDSIVAAYGAETGRQLLSDFTRLVSQSGRAEPIPQGIFSAAEQRQYTEAAIIRHSLVATALSSHITSLSSDTELCRRQITEQRKALLDMLAGLEIPAANIPINDENFSSRVQAHVLERLRNRPGCSGLRDWQGLCIHFGSANDDFSRRFSLFALALGRLDGPEGPINQLRIVSGERDRLSSLLREQEGRFLESHRSLLLEGGFAHQGAMRSLTLSRAFHEIRDNAAAEYRLLERLNREGSAPQIHRERFAAITAEALQIRLTHLLAAGDARQAHALLERFVNSFRDTSSGRRAAQLLIAVTAMRNLQASTEQRLDILANNARLVRTNVSEGLTFARDILERTRIEAPLQNTQTARDRAAHTSAMVDRAPGLIDRIDTWTNGFNSRRAEFLRETLGPTFLRIIQQPGNPEADLLRELNTRFSAAQTQVIELVNAAVELPGEFSQRGAEARRQIQSQTLPALAFNNDAAAALRAFADSPPVSVTPQLGAMEEQSPAVRALVNALGSRSDENAVAALTPWLREHGSPEQSAALQRAIEEDLRGEAVLDRVLAVTPAADRPLLSLIVRAYGQQSTLSLWQSTGVSPGSTAQAESIVTALQNRNLEELRKAPLHLVNSLTALLISTHTLNRVDNLFSNMPLQEREAVRREFERRYSVSLSQAVTAAGAAVSPDATLNEVVNAEGRGISAVIYNLILRSPLFTEDEKNSRFPLRATVGERLQAEVTNLVIVDAGVYQSFTQTHQETLRNLTRERADLLAAISLNGQSSAFNEIHRLEEALNRVNSKVELQVESWVAELERNNPGISQRMNIRAALTSQITEGSVQQSLHLVSHESPLAPVASRIATLVNDGKGQEAMDLVRQLNLSTVGLTIFSHHFRNHVSGLPENSRPPTDLRAALSGVSQDQNYQALLNSLFNPTGSSATLIDYDRRRIATLLSARGPTAELEMLRFCIKIGNPETIIRALPQANVGSDDRLAAVPAAWSNVRDYVRAMQEQNVPLQYVIQLHAQRLGPASDRPDLRGFISSLGEFNRQRVLVNGSEQNLLAAIVAMYNDRYAANASGGPFPNACTEMFPAQSRLWQAIGSQNRLDIAAEITAIAIRERDRAGTAAVDQQLMNIGVQFVNPQELSLLRDTINSRIHAEGGPENFRALLERRDRNTGARDADLIERLLTRGAQEESWISVYETLRNSYNDQLRAVTSLGTNVGETLDIARQFHRDVGENEASTRSVADSYRWYHPGSWFGSASAQRALADAHLRAVNMQQAHINSLSTVQQRINQDTAYVRSMGNLSLRLWIEGDSAASQSAFRSVTQRTSELFTHIRTVDLSPITRETDQTYRALIDRAAELQRAAQANMAIARAVVEAAILIGTAVFVPYGFIIGGMIIAAWRVGEGLYEGKGLGQIFRENWIDFALLGLGAGLSLLRFTRVLLPAREIAATYRSTFIGFRYIEKATEAVQKLTRMLESAQASLRQVQFLAPQFQRAHNWLGHINLLATFPRIGDERRDDPQSPSRARLPEFAPGPVPHGAPHQVNNWLTPAVGNTLTSPAPEPSRPTPAPEIPLPTREPLAEPSNRGRDALNAILGFLREFLNSLGGEYGAGGGPSKPPGPPPIIPPSVPPSAGDTPRDSGGDNGGNAASRGPVVVNDGNALTRETQSPAVGSGETGPAVPPTASSDSNGGNTTPGEKITDTGTNNNVTNPGSVLGSSFGIFGRDSNPLSQPLIGPDSVAVDAAQIIPNPITISNTTGQSTSNASGETNSNADSSSNTNGLTIAVSAGNSMSLAQGALNASAEVDGNQNSIAAPILIPNTVTLAAANSNAQTLDISQGNFQQMPQANQFAHPSRNVVAAYVANAEGQAQYATPLQAAAAASSLQQNSAMQGSPTAQASGVAVSAGQSLTQPTQEALSAQKLHGGILPSLQSDRYVSASVLNPSTVQSSSVSFVSSTTHPAPQSSLSNATHADIKTSQTAATQVISNSPQSSAQSAGVTAQQVHAHATSQEFKPFGSSRAPEPKPAEEIIYRQARLVERKSEALKAESKENEQIIRREKSTETKSESQAVSTDNRKHETTKTGIRSEQREELSVKSPDSVKSDKSERVASEDPTTAKVKEAKPVIPTDLLEAQTPEQSEDGTEQAKKKKAKIAAQRKREREIIIAQLLTGNLPPILRKKMLAMLIELGISEEEYRDLEGRLGELDAQKLVEEAASEQHEAIAIKVETASQGETNPQKEQVNQGKQRSRAELYRQLKKEKV